MNEHKTEQKRCLNCKHEGNICMRQGWGGDEYWCECKQGMPERDRRSFGCEKWEMWDNVERKCRAKAEEYK